jgi:two-component system, response regulator
MSETALDIVMAEDDPDDALLVRAAFEDAHVGVRLAIVEDGERLMQYLRAQGPYAGRPPPRLLLLDLNMPRKDGREVLCEVRQDERLRRLPIVVLTTSSAEEDIRRAYELGVSSYIRKPLTFHNLLEVVGVLCKYWFEVVSLPPCI